MKCQSFVSDTACFFFSFPLVSTVIATSLHRYLHSKVAAFTIWRLYLFVKSKASAFQYWQSKVIISKESFPILRYTSMEVTKIEVTLKNTS